MTTTVLWGLLYITDFGRGVLEGGWDVQQNIPLFAFMLSIGSDLLARSRYIFYLATDCTHLLYMYFYFMH